MNTPADSAKTRPRRGRPRKHPRGISRHERERVAGERMQKTLMQRDSRYVPLARKLSVCVELAKLSDIETAVQHCDGLLRDYPHFLRDSRSLIAVLRARRTGRYRRARTSELADRLWLATFKYLNTRTRCHPAVLRGAVLLFSKRVFRLAEKREKSERSKK